ncbi:hypothetical protein HOO54_16155 [Bacillus sp. WMMC1349]|nr:hypothetical protein [Bacillus sp. WMMC1349]NPC93724.1 hypothetical protein [Bacillus sp. WMMC1349]
MKQNKSTNDYTYDLNGEKETVKLIADAYSSGFVSLDIERKPLTDQKKS